MTERPYSLHMVATRRLSLHPQPAPWWLVLGSCPHGTSTQNVAAVTLDSLRARSDGLASYHRVRMPTADADRSPCKCPLTDLLVSDDPTEGGRDG